jgi:outer membrane protein W
MRKIALFSVLFMLVAIPTFAEQFPSYSVLKLGAYLPQANDVEDFDNSFYGELGIGHYLNPNIAVEFGVGYTKSSASASVTGVGSADVDLTIIPMTIGIKVLSSSMRKFEPFAMAGVGLYYAKAEASASISGFGNFSGSETDTTFGGFLGLGANFNITPNTFLGLEGKYFIASPNFESLDVDIDGIYLTANIGYRF